MSTIQKALIQKAREKYGEISPVSNKKSFAECFTIENGEVWFWFNSADNSTHTMKELASLLPSATTLIDDIVAYEEWKQDYISESEE